MMIGYHKAANLNGPRPQHDYYLCVLRLKYKMTENDTKYAVYLPASSFGLLNIKKSWKMINQLKAHMNNHVLRMINKCYRFVRNCSVIFGRFIQYNSTQNVPAGFF